MALRRVDVEDEEDDREAKPVRRSKTVAPHDVPCNVQETDQVTIRFLAGTKIENRRPGKPYVVDSTLAHHYVNVRKVAEVVNDPNKKMKPVHTAMTAPQGRK